MSACKHERIDENNEAWIETCRDCGAWRDRFSGHPDTWYWREAGSFKKCLNQPPDIGPDVPGGGQTICGALHASTGAVCALSPGHSEPHRAGAVQWSRPVGYPDPPFDARD